MKVCHLFQWHRLEGDQGIRDFKEEGFTGDRHEAF